MKERLHIQKKAVVYYDTFLDAADTQKVKEYMKEQNLADPRYAVEDMVDAGLLKIRWMDWNEIEHAGFEDIVYADVELVDGEED